MKFNYGWVIVGVGVVVTCIGMGASFTLGVFLQPVAQDMGWSRTGISAAGTLNFLAMGIATFIWGALSDRFGARLVVLAGGVLMGLAMAAASQVTALWQFQLLSGAVVGAAAGSFFVPLTALTARWFTSNRSLAVALVSAGLSLGTTTIGPLARWVITEHGWRAAMLVLAAVSWAVIIPATLLIRPAPAASAGTASSAAAARAELSVAQAVRTPAFIAISFAFFACCLTHSGPIFHMVSYAIDCGLPDMAAVTVISVMGLAGLAGKIVCGLIADRVGAKPTLVTGLAVQAAVVVLYLYPRDLFAFYGLGAVFGLAYGGVMPLYAILLRDYFSPRILGTLLGIATMASSLGMAVGPALGGWLFDSFRNYDWMFIWSFGIGLAAVAIATTVRAPRLGLVPVPG
jgi:MFS family permease